MIDEAAIRAAIEAIADEARPATGIRATLDRRVRRYRQRRLVLRVAGVGVAGAVAGLAGLRLSGPHEDNRVIGGPGVQGRPFLLRDGPVGRVAQQPVAEL